MSDAKRRRADWLEISRQLVDYLKGLRAQYTEKEFLERTGVRARTFATWERRFAEDKVCLVSTKKLLALCRRLNRSPEEFGLPPATCAAIELRLDDAGAESQSEPAVHTKPAVGEGPCDGLVHADSSAVGVVWLNRVRTQLSQQAREHLGQALCAAYRGAERLQSIVVCDRLIGYSPGDKPEVLFVELIKEERSFPRIVKIDDAQRAHRSAMQREYDAWSAVKDYLESPDPLFASLADPTPEQSREVLEYDVASGALSFTEIESLEEVVRRSTRFGTPSAESVAQRIRDTFDYLGQKLFARGRPRDSAEVAESYRPRLAERIKTWWRPERVALRRPILLSLGSRPDEFQDPVDWLHWLLSPAGRDCVPECLFGPCHGNLHARNILIALSATSGEAVDQTLYNYETLSTQGPIAWDLVKLEMDLRVRALPYVVGALDEGDNEIEHVLEFERLLYQRTKDLDRYPLRPGKTDRIDFEQPEPWKRLFAMLLEIRRSARACLGGDQRPECWKEEYLFTLAAYSVDTARYGTYDPIQQKLAYIAGGVAAAHFASEDCYCPRSCPRKICCEEVVWSDETIIAAPQEPFTGGALVPNYVFVLADPKKRAQSRNRHQVAAAIDDLEKLSQAYPHAAAIEQELALAKVELSTLVADPRQVAKLRSEAEETLMRLLSELPRGDEETLGKLGRLHKERAWTSDRFCEQPSEAESVHYENALDCYQKAYALRNHYYPGINVATLNFLLGNREEAATVAEQVLQTCAAIKPEDLQHVVERTWVEATRAEAYLILEQYEAAVECYRAAITPELSEAYAASPRRHARCILAKLPDRDPETQRWKQRVRDVLGIPRPDLAVGGG